MLNETFMDTTPYTQRKTAQPVNSESPSILSQKSVCLSHRAKSASLIYNRCQLLESNLSNYYSVAYSSADNCRFAPSFKAMCLQCADGHAKAPIPGKITRDRWPDALMPKDVGLVTDLIRAELRTEWVGPRTSRVHTV